MTLVRHSDRRLTDKIYTDESLLSTWSAIDSLPNFTAKESQALTNSLTSFSRGRSERGTACRNR